MIIVRETESNFTYPYDITDLYGWLVENISKDSSLTMKHSAAKTQRADGKPNSFLTRGNWYLGKQIGTRSGQNASPELDQNNLTVCMIGFLKEFFEKLNFGKSADGIFFEKSTSMHKVRFEKSLSQLFHNKICLGMPGIIG